MPVQTTFPETMKQGLPGMINRMVDFNTVSRNCATAAGIPAGRVVSQGTLDTDAVLGGTLVGALGISVLDPTLIVPYGGAPDTTPQYQQLSILTKGEIFAVAAVAVAAGDPVHFIAADGTLTNTGGIGPIPGARWKYARATIGDLNVIQFGIQR